MTDRKGRAAADGPRARWPTHGSVAHMRDRPDPQAEELRTLIARYGGLWGLPGLEERLSLSFSRRFQTSLGRCAPALGQIRLAAFLLDGPLVLLHEALCHEAAHAAIHELHGLGPKPHGPEWRGLVQAAGFEPRTRVPAELLEGIAPPRRGSRPVWAHRCPVCHGSRVARRAVRRWRCATCRSDGLDGQLVITRLPLRDAAGT